MRGRAHWLVLVALAACQVKDLMYSPTGDARGGDAGGSDAGPIDGTPGIDAPGDGGVGFHATLELVAGNIGGPGNLDGAGAAAHFDDAMLGVAVGSDGTVYVADTNNGTVRLIGSNAEVTTLAFGGSPVQFGHPVDVAVAAGVVYVADATGHVWTADGSGKHELIGSDAGATFRLALKGPTSLVVGSDGMVFLSEGANPGHIVRAGSGSVAVLPVSLGDAGGLTFGSDGALYVADTQQDVIIRVDAVSGAGSTYAGTLGSAGTTAGSAGKAKFDAPSDLTYDAVSQKFYIVDQSGTEVRAITPASGSNSANVAAGVDTSATNVSALAPDGAGGFYVTTRTRVAHTSSTFALMAAASALAGSLVSTGASNGSGSAAVFESPIGLCPAGSGLFLADSLGQDVRSIDLSTTEVSSVPLSSDPSDLFASQLTVPTGLALLGSDQLLITDPSLNVIFSADLTGTNTDTYVVFAGEANQSGNTDGGNLGATFAGPSGIAVDGSGTVYVADTGNSEIRMIAGGSVRKFAPLPGPVGVAVDSSGHVYASASDQTIRAVSLQDASIIAGSSGGFGYQDGSGSDARFAGPRGIAVDGVGNVFVADAGNGVIRKITPDHHVTTIVGIGGELGIRLGSGAAARLSAPTGLALIGGDLYITDTGALLVARGVSP